MALNYPGGDAASNQDSPNISLQKINDLLYNGLTLSAGTITLNTSDIEIGAVELKDATTSNRAVINSAGEIAVTQATGATLVNSSALEASHVLKASAGTLVSLVGYNAKTSSQFIQIFNSTTVPADTSVPVCVFVVPASSNFSLDVPLTGLPLGTGIAVSNSSTSATKTIGSADCFFTSVVK